MRVLRLTEITNRLGQLVIQKEDRKGNFTSEEWHSTITLVFFLPLRVEQWNPLALPLSILSRVDAVGSSIREM